MKGKRRTRLKAEAPCRVHRPTSTTPSRFQRPTSPPRPIPCKTVAVLVILFHCLLSLSSRSSSSSSDGSILLTSATELAAADRPLPEAQPLVYMLHEMGSGEGSRSTSYSRSSISLTTDASTTDADVAPALIEARCWNNYENDNDCKQLNVITAPQIERQNQQQPQTGPDDDSLITPVVIFEASSTIDTPALDNEIEPERPVFMAPPYQSNEIPQRPPAGATDKHKPEHEHEHSATSYPTGLYAATPKTTDSNFEPPATRPTVVHYVATPQPKRVDGSSRRPAVKATTQSRMCRDENDADCDEDEDNQTRSAAPNGPSRAGDSDDNDDDDDNENGDEQDSDQQNKNYQPKLTAPANGGQSNLIGNEPGSGLGPAGQTDDDTDDSTDDGDGDSTGDTGESSGSSSIQENSSRSSDNQLLVITSSYPQESSTGAQSSPMTTSTVPNTRRPPSGGAEIEVVVHSTLPPSFPMNGINQDRSRSKAAHDEFGAATTTTTTTMMPDEIYTSKPIFPPTTSESAPANSLDGPNSESPAPGANQAGQSTTDSADLYTFKSIPLPVEQSEARQSRFEFGQTNGNGGGGGESANQQTEQDHQPAPKHQVSSQHIHEPASPSYRRPFDDSWTTRKPLGSMMNKELLNQQNQAADVFPNRAASKSYNSYMTTETLPTMLLYASIFITVFISLIFIVIYSLWRRNSHRRRALLAKAHMMNGRPPAGMIESMSHVSHLMHGADGLPPQPPAQQGLLSTYARAKGSTIGKVTTSLVKPLEDQSASGLLGQELEEEEENQGRVFKDDESRDQLAIEEEGSSLEENQNQRDQMRPARLADGDGMHNRSGSWSTEDPTTTTSSGSQRTQDSQQQMGARQQAGPMQVNGQRLHHNYPNSLSDGRQNSSSISDSQCSPDPQPSGALVMNPMNQPRQQVAIPPNQTQQMQSHLHMNQPMDQRDPASASSLNPMGHHHQQPPFEHHPLYQPASQHQQPFIRPILRPAQHLNGGLQRMGPMLPAPHAAHSMLVQNGGPMKGMKQRLVASRSIEDITTSQHVGFIESNNNNQLPYNQHQQVRPHLIQARPNYQYPNQHIAMNASPVIRNSIVSPQQVAMSPLATLGRRFPPGQVLNRNIYSEDSSSFMTASPSLARTSSSSSFAFNLSNLPTPSSIKARPIVDSSGRVFNDYTHGLNDHSNNVGHGTNGTPTAPPAFSRSDRGEAWYV